MLNQGYEYALQHDGRAPDLYGQENNGAVWAICRMNLLLHGIPDADIRNGDTLVDPKHIEDGRPHAVRPGDRQSALQPELHQARIQFGDRFRFGWCPTTGKKADLMFAQHMLASLKQTGKMAVVMPHGVLFRGGEEKKIRIALLEDDCIEAVIGLPQNLFYGTGIPACILVMRHPDGKPDARKGKVLFINADREYREGRAQNFIDPEHIEKIVSAYDAFADVPGFAAVIDNTAIIKDEAGNLNIRRYADSSPPPEPHDVRAHLHGGVPKREIESSARMRRHRASTSTRRSSTAMPTTPSSRTSSRSVPISGHSSSRTPALRPGRVRWSLRSMPGGRRLGPGWRSFPKASA